LICQVCGAMNELDRELCRKCQSKLLVVSGTTETYDETPPDDDAVSLDEHLLERVSVLEEVVKRSAETLRILLDAANRQERNDFVAQTGLLALKDLLEKKGLVGEEEMVDLWETRVDHHMAVLEKRERFLERKERMLGGYGGPRRERFRALLSDAETALYALEPDRAVKILEEAFRLDRTNAELAFFLGETYFNEGESERAAAMLRRVLAKEPRHFEALVYAGVLESDAGRPERALELLKTAVAAKPDAFLPYFAVGALLALSGQLPKADAYLKQALAVEENAQAYSLLGVIAYERGRLSEAIDALQKAVRLDPDDEEALYQLGLCYLDRGWTQKAAQKFRAEPEPDRVPGGDEAPAPFRRPRSSEGLGRGGTARPARRGGGPPRPAQGARPLPAGPRARPREPDAPHLPGAPLLGDRPDGGGRRHDPPDPLPPAGGDGRHGGLHDPARGPEGGGEVP